MKIFIFVLLISLASPALADDKIFIETAQNLKLVAETYVKKGKPDKITVIYNSYKIIEENITDKSKLKDCSNFFANTIKNNLSKFRPLRINVTDPPRITSEYYTGVIQQNKPGGNWTHKDIEAINKAIDLGVKPNEVKIDNLGSVQNLDIKTLINLKSKKKMISQPEKWTPTAR